MTTGEAGKTTAMATKGSRTARAEEEAEEAGAGEEDEEVETSTGMGTTITAMDTIKDTKT